MDDAQKNSEMQQMAIDWTSAQPVVAAFVSAIEPDYHDAEDILQRTAATLVTKYKEYDPSRPFVGWAIGIAKIEILRHRQNRQRERTVFSDEVVNAIGAAYTDMAPKLGEMREMLDICLREVGGRAKKILALRYVRDYSPAQVATELNITSNAALVALHRARTALRKCMEKRFSIYGESI